MRAMGPSAARGAIAVLKRTPRAASASSVGVAAGWYPYEPTRSARSVSIVTSSTFGGSAARVAPEPVARWRQAGVSVTAATKAKRVRHRPIRTA